MISAFEASEYSKNKINAASKESIGVEIDGSYIGLHSLNNLALYAFNVDNIPHDIQRSYIKWLHGYDGVIAYTNTRLDDLSKNPVSARVISLLSRFNEYVEEFPGATAFILFEPYVASPQNIRDGIA